VDITIEAPTAHGPYYEQIRSQIAAKIEAGELRSGTALPNPAVLANQLGIDKGEVSRAYFELEQAGLVVSRKSKNFLGETVATFTVC
jgi:GntR family transcriptional regulator